MSVSMTARARFAHLLSETRVYAVTDDRLDEERLVQCVEAIVGAGVRLVQYRDKRRSDRECVRVARTLLKVVHAGGGLLVVNDRADVAIAVQADGVHLGQDDLPAGVGRRLLGEDLVVGVSASFLEELLPAALAGADYMGFGAVFATDTKLDAEYAGLDLLEQACRASPLPVVGIGGISHERARAVIERGAAGVAVVNALFGAPDPKAAAAALLTAVWR